MKYDADIFRNQYPIVESFVQHLAYYRAAKPLYDKLGLQSPFWCATISAHLMIGAIQWCKVFGADGCNETHWKKTLLLNIDEMQDSFREKVIAKAGFSIIDWQNYHAEMCDFRNKYIAHHEIGFASPVPDFDKALKVAYAYDDWIRELIHPDIYSGLRLRQYFETWVKTTTPLVEAAMLASKDREE